MGCLPQLALFRRTFDTNLSCPYCEKNLVSGSIRLYGVSLEAGGTKRCQTKSILSTDVQGEDSKKNKNTAIIHRQKKNITLSKSGNNHLNERKNYESIQLLSHQLNHSSLVISNKSQA